LTTAKTARLALAATLLAASVAHAQQGPSVVSQVGFDQNLGTDVPLDLAFRDEAGRPVKLGDYFGTKPVLLTLVYYRCPMLCTLELNGLARSLKPLSMDVGREFEVVTVSIDPEETPALASEKKAGYLARYNRPGAEKGWHFLTGDRPSIDRLTRAAGFRYAYNPRTKLFAHAAGLVILTPKGRIARYFYGIDYSARDLQFGLLEASAGKVGSPISRLLLLCYHYDPASGKYSLAIMSLVQVLGTATAVALAAFVIAMFRRERRAARALHPATTATATP